MERPGGHRAHACRPGRAGSSGWVAARPIGHRCRSAGRSASGSPAPTRRSARWCRGRGRWPTARASSSTCRCSRRSVLCLTYYPVTYHDMVGRPFRSGRSRVTPGVETTSDGLVGLGVGTGQQWLDFCVMVDHAEWMEDRSLFAQPRPPRPGDRGLDGRAHHRRGARAGRPPSASPTRRSATAPPSRPPTTSRPGAAIVAEPARRVPRARPALPLHPAAAARPGARPAARRARRCPPVASPPPRPAPDDRGCAARTPGSASSTSPRSGPGPCARTCSAMLGAEVVHVESTARPDGTRLLSGVRFSEPDWWEQSGIFSGLNTNKQSVTLDLTDERGRELLRRLLATCDVIVENYTPRVLEQIGPRRSTPSAPSGPTSSWSACPASGSTGPGGTSRPSPS